MTEQQWLNRLSEALLGGLNRAEGDPHRPGWHIAAPVGLLNDPNGFIRFDGRYRLFYQWNPLACAHGAKAWGQLVSDDLVHWQHLGLALAPTEDYERNGCYSGSAVDNNGELTLIYTGNVKYDRERRTAFQCLAVEREFGEFEKLGPVLDLPEGYTGHVRDPKVWRHDGHWWMVLAAQSEDGQGKVLLYQSADLHHWRQIGVLAGSGEQDLGEFGYMWECPDLFELGGRHVLICCPQGLPAEADRYQNLYQCGWLAGELDWHGGRLAHGDFHELDLGFEFYAPQTTLDDQGRRLLIGWLGLPDDNEPAQPTRDYGWMNQLSCPRVLSWREGKLYQNPVPELAALRGEAFDWQGLAVQAPRLQGGRAELELVISGEVRLYLGQAAVLTVNAGGLELRRLNWRSGEWESRRWHGAVTDLRLLLDSSSIELFINEGEAAMSARYFPGAHPEIRWGGAGETRFRYWPLAPVLRQS
ncbi:glycosyl hydrolase family 32 [Zobellella endophytica]|uniref:Sucrose-6-phosphate hydrolase n=1 Tax=Zobellella endophytica TaxID=2116700 RepID=A0A2P7R5X3_9GAMM|nr:sucrose-6-phosphate hydrolase [Zobellella endophytica]PSJ45615.1 glycosyl hydrolase family 32 [Zobellella endophytica]